MCGVLWGVGFHRVGSHCVGSCGAWDLIMCPLIARDLIVRSLIAWGLCTLSPKILFGLFEVHHGGVSRLDRIQPESSHVTLADEPF